MNYGRLRAPDYLKRERTSEMNPDTWKIIAALAGLLAGLYAVVTAPLLKAMKSEIGASEARLKLEIATSKTEIKTDIAALQKKVDALEVRAWR